MADIYVSTAGSDSTGTGAIGSPYASPGKAGSVMAAGDRVIILAGTYTLTSASANVAGGYLDPIAGTASAPSQVVGCTATIGDLDDVDVKDATNAPVITGFSGGPSSPCRATNNFVNFRNVVLDGATFSSFGLIANGANQVHQNLKAVRTASTGFSLGGSSQLLLRVLAISIPTGFSISSSAVLDTCVAALCSAAGANITGGVLSIIRSIFCNGTGTAAGIIAGAANGINIMSSVCYGNGGDGLKLSSSQGSEAVVRNSIFAGNGAFGIDYTTSSLSFFSGNYNAYGWPNTSGNLHNVPAGGKNVTLSADPFINGTGTINTISDAWANFALSASGLTALKANGYPAYLDIGAVQHQDAGGGATSLNRGVLTGGRL